MPTYSATWTDVPQLDVSGDDLIDVLARTAQEYEGMVGDPDDDPDYVSPVLTWAIGWGGNWHVLRLIQDGRQTDVYVEATGTPVAEYVPAIDGDDEEIWQDPETGGVVWLPPGYEGKATGVLEPLYRRVAEPAGSVTS